MFTGSVIIIYCIFEKQLEEEKKCKLKNDLLSYWRVYHCYVVDCSYPVIIQVVQEMVQEMERKLRTRMAVNQEMELMVKL